jgi:host factor-I protein
MRAERAIIASQRARRASRGPPRSFAAQKTLAQDDRQTVPPHWAVAMGRPAPFVYNACMPFRPQPGNPYAKHGRTPPPEETFEEATFLKSLAEKQKPVMIKLMDGQTVRGWIEYYDKSMVRLTREGAPNLFIFKHEIMYITEDSGRKNNK